MFLTYEGKQKGTQVKNLISTIQKSNKDNEDRNIEIKYMDKEYKDIVEPLSKVITPSDLFSL